MSLPQLLTSHVSPEKLPKLTTTSFALLGLLQRQPWSAYELTRYMRNSILRAIWPRAESHLYSEPKLLLKRGYVECREEHNGARKRAVYSITDSGLAALSSWLQEQRDSEFRFEYELLVRLAFAETVDTPWVVHYLNQVREEALRDAEVARLGVDAVLEQASWKEHPGAPYTGAILLLIADQLEARINWAATTSERFMRLAEQEAEAGELPGLARELYEEASQRLSRILERGI